MRCSGWRPTPDSACMAERLQQLDVRSQAYLQSLVSQKPNKKDEIIYLFSDYLVASRKLLGDLSLSPLTVPCFCEDSDCNGSATTDTALSPGAPNPSPDVPTLSEGQRWALQAHPNLVMGRPEPVLDSPILRAHRTVILKLLWKMPITEEDTRALHPAFYPFIKKVVFLKAGADVDVS